MSEFDRRRPLTPSGTKLLGLVKHLAGTEFGYLGGSVGRPGPVLPWYEDGSVGENSDMWAKVEETSEYLLPPPTCFSSYDIEHGQRRADPAVGG